MKRPINETARQTVCTDVAFKVFPADVTYIGEEVGVADLYATLA